MKQDIDISEVAGSLRYGFYMGKVVKALLIVLDVCAAILLFIGALMGILGACGVEPLDGGDIALLGVFVGIGILIFAIHIAIYLREKRHVAYFYRSLEAGDLQRSSAKVCVTSEPTYGRHGVRGPAIATLRFKLDGKKYEKSKIGLPAKWARYYRLDILYSPSRDALFYLKMQ